MVDHWQGPRQASYNSTTALPLRGRLHLYFLTPEEFEQPTGEAQKLLQRVGHAYAILLENPYEYAHAVMSRAESFPAQDTADTDPRDPVSFLQGQNLMPAAH